MPLYEYQCRQCGHLNEFLIRRPDDEQGIECERPECQSADLRRVLSAHGGYQINGDNSASTRPRKSRASE